MYKIFNVKRAISGKLPFGEDILESLKKVSKSENIRVANIHILGAVKNATIGFYNQSMKEYTSLKFYEPMEIVSSLGNVSIKSDDIFIHLHVTLSDKEGKALGGHLMSPTEIFACEFTIQELEGDDLVRKFDERTGLYLWDL